MPHELFHFGDLKFKTGDNQLRIKFFNSPKNTRKMQKLILFFI